jgi:predicted GIY-YIG superfamily endonuclease
MSFEKSYYVYILASLSGTLYIGITNNLERRIVEHKEGLISVLRNNTACAGWSILKFTAMSEMQSAAKSS